MTVSVDVKHGSGLGQLALRKHRGPVVIVSRPPTLTCWLYSKEPNSRATRRCGGLSIVRRSGLRHVANTGDSRLEATRSSPRVMTAGAFLRHERRYHGLGVQGRR